VSFQPAYRARLKGVRVSALLIGALQLLSMSPAPDRSQAGRTTTTGLKYRA